MRTLKISYLGIKDLSSVLAALLKVLPGSPQGTEKKKNLKRVNSFSSVSICEAPLQCQSTLLLWSSPPQNTPGQSSLPPDKLKLTMLEAASSSARPTKLNYYFRESSRFVEQGVPPKPALSGVLGQSCTPSRNPLAPCPRV